MTTMAIPLGMHLSGGGTRVRRKKSLIEKIRVTLDLSPEFYSHLEMLEERTGAESKAQLIREALRLYSYVVDRSLDGAQFLTRKKTGEEESIVFLGAIPASQ
jgi:predicted DNA-binding protein